MYSYTAIYHLFLQLVQVEPEPLGIPFPLNGTGGACISGGQSSSKVQLLSLPLRAIGTCGSVVTGAVSPSAVGLGGAGGH